MINSRKDLKNYIDYEKGFYGKNKAKLFGPVISEKSIAWKYLCLLRYEEYHANNNHRILALFFRYLKVKMGRKFDLDFPINVIEMGVRISHPHDITVNASHVGKDCVLHFNSAMVKGNGGKIPSIGDRVVVGCGAVIVGGVSLANGIIVGANSTVTHSFTEEGITIAGSPSKKIH